MMIVCLFISGRTLSSNYHLCRPPEIPLHHCKLGLAGHLISDTSSEQTNIQYVEWGLVGTAGRKVLTHFLPVLCAGGGGGVWFVCEK